MKIKKLKKLSIFTMLLALTMSAIPSIAADSDEADLNVTFDSYFSLIQSSDSTITGAVERTNKTTLTLTNPITLSYSLTSNEPSQIRISATAPVSDGGESGTVNALFGTAADDMKIVFTKSDSTSTSAAVTNAGSTTPAASSNANAVAFKIKYNNPSTLSTYGSGPQISVSNNAFLYDFEVGSYSFPLGIEGTSLTGTFSDDDVGGDYKATLFVEKVDT